MATCNITCYSSYFTRPNIVPSRYSIQGNEVMTRLGSNDQEYESETENSKDDFQVKNKFGSDTGSGGGIGYTEENCCR